MNAGGKRPCGMKSPFALGPAGIFLSQRGAVPASPKQKRDFTVKSHLSGIAMEGERVMDNATSNQIPEISEVLMNVSYRGQVE